MRKLAVLALVVAVVGPVRADDAPKMPAPQKEHAALAAFAGEWETDAEMVMAPGKPPEKAKGTEKGRTLNFWLVSDYKSECMGQPMIGQMTVGYDAAKGKYVGTWFCSVCPILWKYEGTLDASGKVLTLNTEGPNPADPTKSSKMRDVTTLIDANHKVMKSEILGDDGKWTTFMTLHSRRAGK